MWRFKANPQNIGVYVFSLCVFYFQLIIEEYAKVILISVKHDEWLIASKQDIFEFCLITLWITLDAHRFTLQCILSMSHR